MTMRGLLGYQSVAIPSSPNLSSPLPMIFTNRNHRSFFRRRCSISVANDIVTEADNVGSIVHRRLILLRHADSSWENRSLRDHDRPISEAGRNDAADVSRKLQEMGWIPELILSSDATRTKETLQIMRESAHGFLKAKVHFMPSFYSVAAMDGQTAEHLQKAICQYSKDDILTVMCMGHNKGWEEAASMFCGVYIDLDTSNAALLESKGGSWHEAFSLAGLGGWKLHSVVKPNSTS